MPLFFLTISHYHRSRHLLATAIGRNYPDVGHHLPTSLLNPKLRKRSIMVWKLIQMISILQWKYQRKSTKGKNIFILGRFHGRINNLLSKGEDKSKRKDLDENKENSQRTEETMFTGHYSLETLFTGYCSLEHCSWDTVHPREHCSPGYCSHADYSRRGLGTPFPRTLFPRILHSVHPFYRGPPFSHFPLGAPFPQRTRHTLPLGAPFDPRIT
jgi:hypothetical protein